MNTFCTTRFALILLLAGCTTPLLAQQVTHRAAASKRTAVAAKPHVATRKPVATTRSTAVATSAPAGSTQSAQPVTTPAVDTQPVVTATQPAPVRPTTGTANRTQTSFGSSRNKYLNVGVGLAAYYGAGLPLGASFEVDVANNFSVGGSVDYLHYSGGYTFIYAGARGSYHVGELLGVQDKKFDPYVGATLGFRHTSYAYSYGYYDYGSYNSGLYLGVHLGSRYYFGEKVGGFAEVGYGVSAVRLGLTAKF